MTSKSMRESEGSTQNGLGVHGLGKALQAVVRVCVDGIGAGSLGQKEKELPSRRVPWSWRHVFSVRTCEARSCCRSRRDL